MTEVIKIVCAKDDRRYEVSVSRMTEVIKIMCTKDDRRYEVSVQDDRTSQDNVC